MNVVKIGTSGAISSQVPGLAPIKRNFLGNPLSKIQPMPVTGKATTVVTPGGQPRPAIVIGQQAAPPHQQQIQITRLPSGQLAIKGLQPGQSAQLMKLPDGRLQLITTSTTSAPVTQPPPATAATAAAAAVVRPAPPMLHINKQQQAPVVSGVIQTAVRPVSGGVGTPTQIRMIRPMISPVVRLAPQQQPQLPVVQVTRTPLPAAVKVCRPQVGWSVSGRGPRRVVRTGLT
ncbi:PREDICTED: nucleosome-remodeling factor subunit NURF301-like [Priapulus caudatus]|uniref:Nucleosome-remodeling factor subunit NURF301-like n=1 Tax=Priapulus caudatus TaxID=37621 RepID=A0ABM1F2J1_PRICU|nr:PREDICTED: nucleosome-remodeling factor subunit NURF301-like [Priapulus caudatus]